MAINYKNGLVYAFIFVTFYSLRLTCFPIETQTAKKYRFTDMFTFGIEEAKEEKDEPYQFYNIMSLDCDKEENIYVLDFTGNCVKKFDGTGKFIKKLFRKGKGPNEISDPIGIGINKYTDHIFIIQDFGFTMKEFDLDGNYIKYYVLPVRGGSRFGFLGNEKFICLNSIPKEETFYNFFVVDFKQQKLLKKIAPIKMVYELNLKQYFAIMNDSELWTSRGNEMKLFAFDLNTGEQLREIEIPGKYKPNKLLEIYVTQDSKMVHPILYNIAQPFIIEEQVFALVIMQEYNEKAGKTEKYPSSSRRLIYQVLPEEKKLLEIGPLENSDGMVVGTVSNNKLILFSNDPYGRIRVLEFK